MGTAAIEATDLRKTYGNTAALAGLTLRVDEGECMALVGPNGAGKTTFTEICAGYRSADSGTVHVLGVNPGTAPRSWFTNIGIVLQAAHDLLDITVREAVSHFSSYYPSPRSIDEVIHSVGLTDKESARIGKLSGGQRRRLDVALGIIGRPQVLFLDEPTTGFDPEARREFWTLIEGLKREGTTILLTTHYLDEAEHLADRVAVISRGRVLTCDTPSRIGGRENGYREVRWFQDNAEQQKRTDKPSAFIGELSAQFGGEVPGLVVRQPSLEDAYLNLIAADERVAP